MARRHTPRHAQVNKCKVFKEIYNVIQYTMNIKINKKTNTSLDTSNGCNDYTISTRTRPRGFEKGGSSVQNQPGNFGTISENVTVQHNSLEKVGSFEHTTPHPLPPHLTSPPRTGIAIYVSKLPIFASLPLPWPPTHTLVALFSVNVNCSSDSQSGEPSQKFF